MSRKLRTGANPAGSTAPNTVAPRSNRPGPKHWPVGKDYAHAAHHAFAAHRPGTETVGHANPGAAPPNPFEPGRSRDPQLAVFADPAAATTSADSPITRSERRPILSLK